MELDDYANLIKKQFTQSRSLLAAIGDETRQALIVALMGADCYGMRVGEITEKIHLSRPAVSHHLRVLLDADVIGVTPEGTKNYYWLKLGGPWQTFVELVNNIEKLRVASDCEWA
jgi:ArsR family transcriptional regulator